MWYRCVLEVPDLNYHRHRCCYPFCNRRPVQLLWVNTIMNKFVH